MQLSEAHLLAGDDMQRLIARHAGDNAHAFALARHKEMPLQSRLIAEQIACRQKAVRKLPAISCGKFVYESRALEIASGEATARFKASFMHGTRMMDMSGGMGIDTFYCAESFDCVDYYEKIPVLCELLRINSRFLKRSNIYVHEGDSVLALRRCSSDEFDWLYVDPLRRSATKRRIGLTGCEPDVIENAAFMLDRAKRICIKCSPMLEPEAARRRVPHIAACIVVSVDGECKEQLLILDKHSAACGTLPMRAVMLAPDGTVRAAISNTESAGVERRIAAAIGTYWYEPDAALIKARLVPQLAAMHGLAFVNSTVDYLTGDTAANGFAGKIWRVIAVEAWNRRRLMKYFREGALRAANISRRDFPLSPAEIRKKLSLREGGEDHLFFTRDSTGKRIMAHCRRIVW